MAYSTPHSANEYLKGACLSVCHDYVLRCQRRSEEARKELLLATREIDLCAGIAAFFGPSAYLAAQGTNDIDIIVDGPTIRTEVKYFPSPARAWNNTRGDWDWLLEAANVGDEFAKRAWILFLPSVSFRNFTECITVTKSHGEQFASLDFAPFIPFVEPVVPANGTNQRLVYRDEPNIQRTSVIRLPGGKRVLAEVVGSVDHPLWCIIYTRIPAMPVAADVLPIEISVTADPFQPPVAPAPAPPVPVAAIAPAN